MKENVTWFLGADILTSTAFMILQMDTGEFVIANTVKVLAAIFVGFIGGFMGLLGKSMAEDHLRIRKMKRDAKNKNKR